MPVYKYTNKKGTMWRVHINYTQDGEHKQICKRGFTSKREALQYEQTLSATLKAPGGAQNLSEALYAILGINAPLSDQTPSEAVKTPVEAIRTFQTVFDEYWATTDARGLSEGTRETKINMLTKHVLPYFGACVLTEITPAMVQQWQTEIKAKERRGKPFSATYLHSIQSQLNAILNYAVRKGYIAYSPMVDLKNMGEKNAPPRTFWTVDEYAKFAEFAKQRPDTYVIFSLCFWLGIRRGEAMAIRPIDVSYDNRRNSYTLHIATSVDAKKRVGATKTASSNRIITLPDFIKRELDEYQEHQYNLQPTDRIFEHISVTTLNRDKDWAIEQSGVPYICIHGMRHSAASNLISSGELTATDVARWLGHSSAKTTVNVRNPHTN